MSVRKKDKEDDLKVKPVSSVVKKLKKQYDKNPKDWRVIGSKDKDGNLDTFITKKPDAYWLKSKQLGPYSSLSMGSYVRNIDRDIDANVGKKMSPDDMLRLFGMGRTVMTMLLHYGTMEKTLFTISTAFQQRLHGAISP